MSNLVRCERAGECECKIGCPHSEPHTPKKVTTRLFCNEDRRGAKCYIAKGGFYCIPTDSSDEETKPNDR